MRDFVDYRSMYDYASNVEALISSIQDLLDAGHGEAVVQLCEHALEALEDAMGRVDDSDGYMASIRDHLVTLHHDACVEALQDAEALARRLFDWELYSEWEIFFGAASTYEDVLGPGGWRPSDDSPRTCGTRCRLGSRAPNTSIRGFAFASPTSWSRLPAFRATSTSW